MNRRGFGVTAVTVLCTIVGTLCSPRAEADPPPGAQRLVVRLAPGAATRTGVSPAASGFGIADIQRIHDRYAVTSAESFLPRTGALQKHPLQNIWLIDVPESADPEELLSEYRSVPEVVYAEVDRPLTLFAVNDSLYHLQWALRNTGQEHPTVVLVQGAGNDTLSSASGLAGADIHAHDVLSGPSGADTAVLAIIDTGVDPLHPDLTGKIWRNLREVPGNKVDDDHNGYLDDAAGWDHSGDAFKIPQIGNGDASPMDYHGHGTHCAGIAAARTNNERGIAGVGGECLVMPLKIFPLALTSVAARALIYAADNGADVVSMSWGGPWRTHVLEDAIQYALAAGVVLCAAAGNDGSRDPSYPAAYPGVIAVGASDHADRVTTFSNFGEHLSVVAPGLDVLSLRANGTDMYAPAEPGVHKIGTGYYLASGTSMAAPFVAGAAARMRSASPGLLPQPFRELLEASALDLVDPMGTGADLPGRDVHSGAGRLDLGALMSLAPSEAAQITWPRPFVMISGSMEVTGTALSQSGLSYTLEYGEGGMPASWTHVTTGPANVQEGPLGVWSTAGLDGLYTLRLRVGHANAADVKVFVGNSRLAEITAPTEGDSVTSWIDLRGSASDPDFVAYLVELGEGTTPGQWTVIHHGTQPVKDGPLTSWQGEQLPDGWYSFRLRLITDAGETAADTVAFYLRSTFSTSRAWKVPLGTSGTALVASYGDLNRDDELEILIATSGGIRAFRPDGQIDMATQDRLARTGPCSLPLAIGDTDGDGKDDLVAINNSGLIWLLPSSEQARAINTGDPPLLGNVNGIEEYILPTLFLKDIDGDNRDEIHYFPGYAASTPRSYWVYWSDGRDPLEITRARFTTRLEFMEYFPADLDADGLDELYIAQEQLFRLDASGALLDSVALVDSAGRAAEARSCSALDLDLDGRLELVIMAVTTGAPSTYVLYVFEDDLALKPGWPRNTGIEYYWTPSDPMFCDTDGDLAPEYFISWFDTELGRISAWHPDGSPLSGHSSYGVWTSSLEPAKLRSPIAADLNADGLADLLACATEDMYLTNPVERILAWDQLGHLLPGWPVIVESGTTLPGSSRRQTTACGDIDRNGITDVMMVTSENNLVFINVPGAVYDSGTARADFWRYNRRLNSTVTVPGQLAVTSCSPTRLQANVPAGTTVKVGFNLALDLAQDFSALVQVSGNVTGIHTGTVGYDPVTRQLSLESAIGFAEGEMVTVRLSSDLRSETGARLPREFTTVFPVGASVPDVLSPYPAPGDRNVPRDASISFVLSTPVDTETLADSTIEVVGNVHGRYTGVFAYDSQTRLATFAPHTEFGPAELITVTVRPGITSAQGITRDSAFGWSFVIAWPQVTSTVPAAYGVGVPRSTYVSATVDGALPPDAVHDSSLLVYSATSGRIPGEVTFVPSTKSLRFSPTQPFALGERLTAVVPALQRVWEFGINTVGGTIRFEPTVTYATDASPRLVTAGDLDGDGYLDLVAGRTPSPFVYLLRQAQPGAFRVDWVLTGGTVGQTVLADLDADSDLDLVATDQIGHSLAVLFNAGDGRFTPPTVVAVPDILECAVHDFNGDGHLDLLSQAMSAASVAILLGAGDGTFRELPRLVTPAALTSAAAIDFNSDGRVDVAAGDVAGNISLYAGTGEERFTPPTSWSSGGRIKHLLAADCDRDGDADLLALHPGGELELWRNGAGVFALDTTYPLPPGTQLMTAADLDADGRLDLAVAGGASRKVHIFKGSATGRFAPAAELAFPDSVWSVAIADLDKDGDFDLATGGQHSISVTHFGSGSAVGDEASTLPLTYELDQNCPNPFNPATTLNFAVPEASHVTLEVFNILGQRVAVLKDEVLTPGYYSLTWEGRADSGSPLPSGVYFYRLQSGQAAIARRMLLLK